MFQRENDAVHAIPLFSQLRKNILNVHLFRPIINPLPHMKKP